VFPGLAGPIAALQAPLGNPNSLALADNGDLLIADAGNNVVLRLSADGTLRVVAGNGAQAYSGNGGPATAASLINPAAISVDKAGNIYIQDFGKANLMADPVCGIRRVSVDGTISTIAGGAATCGTQLIPGIGITVDPAGNPVVADQHFVRRINVDGSSTTIAGSGGDAPVCDTGNGAGPVQPPIVTGDRPLPQLCRPGQSLTIRPGLVILPRRSMRAFAKSMLTESFPRSPDSAPIVLEVILLTEPMPPQPESATRERWLSAPTESFTSSKVFSYVPSPTEPWARL
jgi:hypothetical protein